MKYRAINARTREQVGDTFEAPDFEAAKVVDAMREDSMTKIIVYELMMVPMRAEPMPPAILGVDMASGEDRGDVHLPDRFFAEVERSLHNWLNYSRERPTGIPAGHHLGVHVHRGPRENLAGRWEISFLLVQDEPAKTDPGK